MKTKHSCKVDVHCNSQVPKTYNNISSNPPQMPQFDMNQNNGVTGVEADYLPTSSTKVTPSCCEHEQFDFMPYQ